MLWGVAQNGTRDHRINLSRELAAAIRAVDGGYRFS